jgi:hypothetical protein
MMLLNTMREKDRGKTLRNATTQNIAQCTINALSANAANTKC